MLRCERDCHDGEADEEGVSEMQRRHGGVLIAELVLCPDAAFALGAVDGVDETVAARFFAHFTRDVGVGEEARRHARPEGEDDKSD